MAADTSPVALEGINHEEPVQEAEELGDASSLHHTVILGWSNKLAPLLRQLAVANQSLGGGWIGVVAEREVDQMELDIKTQNIEMFGTTVDYYSGSCLDSEVLRKTSISNASSIIILAEGQVADENDEVAVNIIKTIFSVVDEDEFKGHIVVELSDIDNETYVKQVGGDHVETVVAQDVISRLMIQCARQPGLAQVWEDILGFENAEFYIKRWPELDGMQFADVLLSFPDAIPCGVKVAARKGKIVLNPDDDYVLAEGDEVLVVADDDDSYAPSSSLPEVRMPSIRPPKVVSNKKPVKKILFCGWRCDMEDMITALEKSLGLGSELWVFSEVPQKERERRLTEKGVDPEHFENVKLIHCTGSAGCKKDLESLPIETFDSILLVADGDTVFDADKSRPLTTLILLKTIQSKRLPYIEARAVQIRPAGNTQSTWIDELQHSTSQSIIISEVLDAQTKEVIAEADPRQIVISDEMVSMALAMVAEDKQINGVLDELFAEEGNEMFIRPAEMYLDEETEELSFYEIMMRARRRHEIVIGYHRVFEERPVINPPNKATCKTWSLDDSFIVLVEKL